MKKITATILCMMMLAGLTGCGKEQQAEAPELLEPVGVKLDTAVAKMGDIYDIAVYSGEVVPYVEEVCFTMDGKLGQWKVSIGDTVKEGQVLAVLEDEGIREEIQNLEEQIEELQITGEFSDRSLLADIAIAKAQLWISKDAGASKESCSAKEVEVEMLEAKLRQAGELRSLKLERLNKQLAKQREKLAGISITAPFDGQVVYVMPIEEGDSVSSYATMICIADEERLSIQSEYISSQQIARADSVSARVMDQDYDVTYVPYDDSEYISMVLSGEELKSHFAIDQGAQELKSGQYAVITIISSYQENVLVIPANSLYRDEQGYYVYKIVDDQRVRCNVTVGKITDVEAEITEGLKEGDVIAGEQLLMSSQGNYEIAAVQKGDYVKESQGSASVVYPIRTELSWENGSARYDEILVRKGDVVKEGEVLATFVIEESDVELQELKLKLQRTEEQFEKEKQERLTAIAKAKEDAKEELNAHRLTIAEQNIEKLQISYEKYIYQTEKEIANLKEQMEEISEILEDNQLVAPYDGIIESVITYNQGDKVTAGKTLITMYSTEGYLLKADGAEGKLRYNMDVTIETGRKNDRKTLTGKVIAASNILPTTVSQSYTVIQVDGNVSPDTFVQSIQYKGNTEELRDILLVKKKAVHTEDKKNYVYTWENETVLKRFVVKGLNNLEDIWILDGLSEGQSVILD